MLKSKLQIGKTDSQTGRALALQNGSSNICGSRVPFSNNNQKMFLTFRFLFWFGWKINTGNYLKCRQKIMHKIFGSINKMFNVSTPHSLFVFFLLGNNQKWFALASLWLDVFILLTLSKPIVFFLTYLTLGLNMGEINFMVYRKKWNPKYYLDYKNILKTAV